MKNKGGLCFLAMVTEGTVGQQLESFYKSIGFVKERMEFFPRNVKTCFDSR
jgi:hypothetical protein